MVETELAVSEGDLEPVRVEGTRIVAEAEAMVVDDPFSYECAGENLQSVHAAVKKLDALFKNAEDKSDENVHTAKEARRALKESKEILTGPLLGAKAVISDKMTVCRQKEAEERKRAEFEAWAAAQKVAETERAARAAALKKSGKKAEAAAVAAAPVVAKAVVLAPALPKVSGVGGRKNWVFQVDDENLIPEQYWIRTLNTSMLNAQARAQKEHCNIPGGHATYAEKTIPRASAA